MNNWEKAYTEKRFSIKTQKPSWVVQAVVAKLKPGSKALDLGCGEGRNTIFLAKKGFSIDAVDIADIKILHNQPNEIRSRINFTQETAVGKYNLDYYDLIIAARLFQYLSPDELKTLIQSVYLSLKEGGMFVSCYTEQGGIFKEDIDIDKYPHSLVFVKKLLEESGFKNVDIKQGDSISKYVPYLRPIKSFDIITQKIKGKH